MDENAAYDLDLSCSLEAGITKLQSTQEDLKTLVGLDVESYRIARQILDQKEREASLLEIGLCRSTQFPFGHRPLHSEENVARRTIEAAMRKAGSDQVLAQQVANFDSIYHDDRHQNYRQISPNGRSAIRKARSLV